MLAAFHFRYFYFPSFFLFFSFLSSSCFPLFFFFFFLPLLPSSSSSVVYASLYLILSLPPFPSLLPPSSLQNNETIKTTQLNKSNSGGNIHHTTHVFRNRNRSSNSNTSNKGPDLFSGRLPPELGCPHAQQPHSDYNCQSHQQWRKVSCPELGDHLSFHSDRRTGYIVRQRSVPGGCSLFYSTCRSGSDELIDEFKLDDKYRK